MVLFIKQETGCNKQFNDLEVRQREDEGRDGGGRVQGGRVDGWKKSMLPSHHQCNQIMQPMNKKDMQTHSDTNSDIFF